jgi:prepilin peptidase CpaA
MVIHNNEMVYVAASLIVTGIASVHDIRDRRIPNLLTGPSIVLALGLHFYLGGWAALGSSALAGLIAGSIFVLFFIAGGLGAGDVKLMTAVGCFVGTTMLAEVLISTVIIGGVFALIVSLHRGRLGKTLSNAVLLIRHHQQRGLKPHPELNLMNTNTVRLPYALPIAAGCLAAAWTLATRG